MKRIFLLILLLIVSITGLAYGEDWKEDPSSPSYTENTYTANANLFIAPYASPRYDLTLNRNLVILDSILGDVEYNADLTDDVTKWVSVTYPNLDTDSTDDLVIDDVYTAIKGSGFENRTDSSIAFEDSSRTLTITGTFNIYSQVAGVTTKYSKTTAGIIIPDVEGLYFVYYTALGVLTQSTTAWDFTTGKIFVATVYWDGTKGLLTDERHGVIMDDATHELLHDCIGTLYETGLAGTITDSGFIIAEGQIDDEDLEIDIDEQKFCRVVWNDAGTGTIDCTTAQNKYYYESSDIIQYDDGDGTPADVDNNSYVAYWLFATNEIATPIYSIMGQRTDVLLANARENNTLSSLNLRIPSKEYRVLYRVILQRSGTSETYIESTDYRAVSPSPSGTYVPTDHGTLAGLTDNDHTQYLLRTDVTPTGAISNGSTALVTADTVYDAGYITDGNTGWDNTYNLLDKDTDSITALSGNLSVGQFNSGTNASGSTYWRGDGTWVAVSGSADTDWTESGDIISTVDDVYVFGNVSVSECITIADTIFCDTFETIDGTGDFSIENGGLTIEGCLTVSSMLSPTGTVYEMVWDSATGQVGRSNVAFPIGGGSVGSGDIEGVNVSGLLGGGGDSGTVTVSLGVIDISSASTVSGTLRHENGGLEADVSAYNGFVKISGGSTSAVTANAGTDITADLEEEVTEGSLADSVIVSADIKDGEVGHLDIATDAVGADELSASAVESELEAVLDLAELQGEVTTAQLPDNVTTGLVLTTDLASLAVDVTTSKGVFVADSAYGAGWNGRTNVPTMNAVYDAIEALEVGGMTNIVDTAEGVQITGDATVSVNVTAVGGIFSADVAYGSSWNGKTQLPTMNALYDKIETLGGSSIWTDTEEGAYIGQNLTVDGSLSLGNNLTVNKDLRVNGDLTVDGINLLAFSRGDLYGNGQIWQDGSNLIELTVTGTGLVKMWADLSVDDSLTVDNTIWAVYYRGAGTYLTALDGENITDDTIDDDSIDFTDVTLADLTFDVGSVDTTEFGYLNGVTSSIQDQLGGKQATVTEGSLADNVIVSADIKDGEVGSGDLADGTQASPITFTNLQSQDATVTGSLSVSTLVYTRNRMSQPIMSLNINTPTVSFDDIKKKFPRPMTVTAVYIFVTGGTSVECSLGAVDSDGNDSDIADVNGANFTASAGTQLADTSMGGTATLLADEWLQFDTVAVTGAVTNISVTVYGYET